MIDREPISEAERAEAANQRALENRMERDDIAEGDRSRAALHAEITPGPWRYGHDGHGGISIEGADGVQVAFVRAAREGNARLMTASLELLEQARRFQQAIMQLRARTWTERDVIAMQGDLDAVISKATGGKS